MEERNTRFFKLSSQYCTKCKDEFFIQLTDMYCLLLMKEHQMNTKACIEICVIEKLMFSIYGYFFSKYKINRVSVCAIIMTYRQMKQYVFLKFSFRKQ